MKIEAKKVVQFNYKLSDESGQSLESSDQDHPVAYLHGHNNMMAGLEKALEEVGHRVHHRDRVLVRHGSGDFAGIPHAPIIGRRAWRRHARSEKHCWVAGEFSIRNPGTHEV